VRALRDGIGRSAVAWESVIELASRHLVSPALYEGFVSKGLLPELPAEVRSYLEAVHELNRERNRRIAGQLHEIIAALNRAGIEPVLLKGVAYLAGDLYRDPAARVIGDIDLLVSGEELPAAVAALAAIGYREAGIDDFSFAAHHHHTPLGRDDDVALVELHSEPLARAFAALLPAARMRASARRVDMGGHRCHLPALQDQVVHNVVHAQLSDQHYWSGLASLRPLCDLVRLRAANDRQIDWREILAAFDRAGRGSACRAWLMTAEQLFGQGLPRGVQPDLGARIACWRIRNQRRRRWLMVAGAWYGYHCAMLAQLRAGRSGRRRVIGRLSHPNGYRRYLRSLRMRIRRAQ
jgi:hypothetical protein